MIIFQAFLQQSFDHPYLPPTSPLPSPTFDHSGLRDYWNYLDSKLFCRLEAVYSSATRKLEFGLLKFYLVSAHQSGRQERIADFFEKMTPELQKIHEWRDWFAFPFVKNPEGEGGRDGGTLSREIERDHEGS